MSTKVSRKSRTTDIRIKSDATPGYEKLFVIVSLAFFVFFPFIARLNIETVTEVEQVYFDTTQGRIVDIALYSKEIAIAAFAAIAILFFGGERIFTDRPEKIDRGVVRSIKLPLVMMLVMLLFATLSLIASEYKTVAFRGVYTEYEGYLALISYFIVFMFGCYYMRRSDCRRLLRTAVIVLSVIAGCLSAVEIFYKALLELRFVQHLISPEEYYELAESIQNLYFDGQSALLFNNPGFLGGFAALLIPIDLGICLRADKKATRIWGIAATAFMSIAMYGSHSKAAMFSLIVSVPVTILLCIKGQIKKVIIRTGIIAVSCAAAVGLTLLLRSFSYDSVSGELFVANEVQSVSESSGTLYKLDKAVLEDGVLSFTSGDNTLVCSVDIQKFDVYMTVDMPETSFVDLIKFTDGDGNELGREVSYYDNDRVDLHLKGVCPVDERFDMITIATEGQMTYFCFGYDGPAQFAITSEGFKSFAQGEILEDIIPQPRITGLESLYGFATGRGYIWIQSLPVLADCLFIGKGCGNFTFNFVQNDLVGLLNTNGSAKYVIDRPHNWYIQTAVSNGIPALIAMLVLFGYVVIVGGKRLYKNRSEIDCLDAGLYAGLIGFMITGIINDSCITVNPFFWLMMGVFVRRMANFTCKDKNTML